MLPLFILFTRAVRRKPNGYEAYLFLQYDTIQLFVKLRKLAMLPLFHPFHTCCSPNLCILPLSTRRIFASDN